MLPGNGAPAARSPLQLPVRAIVGSHSVATATPRTAAPVCTPTDAGTTWRMAVCPWAPERKSAPRCGSQNAGGSATPTGLATPIGLATPVNFWPAPSSWSGEQCSTPSSSTSIYTPYNAASTIHRTSSCPWAPGRKPAPSLSADSVGSTPQGSPMGLATPVNFWPGTPVNGCSSRRASLPVQGPLARLMYGADSTPMASLRRKGSLDLGQPGSYSMPVASFTSKNQRGFEGLTPMSMDATPISHDASPSGADWLSCYLADVETPNASLNQARFLDSQPSTPVFMSSCPVTPHNCRVVVHNAFGMPTVDEAVSTQDARLSSPQPASASMEEKPKQDGGDWMPPAESIMGGA